MPSVPRTASSKICSANVICGLDLSRGVQRLTKSLFQEPANLIVNRVDRRLAAKQKHAFQSIGEQHEDRGRRSRAGRRHRRLCHDDARHRFGDRARRSQDRFSRGPSARHSGRHALGISRPGPRRGGGRSRRRGHCRACGRRQPKARGKPAGPSDAERRNLCGDRAGGGGSDAGHHLPGRVESGRRHDADCDRSRQPARVSRGNG